jgi:transposase
LLHLLGRDPTQRPFHLGWSQWRRQHQWRAQQAHSRRRALQAESVSAADVSAVSLLPAPLVIASLPPLTKERWERIAPLLPPQRPPTGRPATNHRQILEGMLWVMHAGTSWRQMPSRYGPWHTVYGRFQRWTREGLWAQIRAVLLTPSHLSL